MRISVIDNECDNLTGFLAFFDSFPSDVNNRWRATPPEKYHPRILSKQYVRKDQEEKQEKSYRDL